jgi:hypothetical protein
MSESSFGQFLEAEKDWLFLEIDRFTHPDLPPEDGIDYYDLRAPWNRFFEHQDASELRAELSGRAARDGKAGCVVTFPSGVVLVPGHLQAADGFSGWVLYGTAADCILSFLEREADLSRGLNLPHWLVNNAETYLRFSMPALASYRINVFTPNGERRSHAIVFDELSERALAINARPACSGQPPSPAPPAPPRRRRGRRGSP